MTPLYNTEQVEKQIRAALPSIIGEFVTLYGEQFRGTIEDRIGSMNLLVYNNPEDVKRYFSSQLREMNKGLVGEFFKEAGMEVEASKEKEMAEKILGYESISSKFLVDFSIKFTNIDAFSNELQELLPSRLIKMRCEVLKAFGINATQENYDEIIKSDEVKRIMPQIQALYNSKKKFEQLVLARKQEFDEVRASAEAEKEEREKINNALVEEFLKEIISRYPERIYDIDDMEPGMDTEANLYCDGIATAGSITAFSKEAFEELNSIETDMIKKKQIKIKQLRYLRKKGIKINVDIASASYDVISSIYEEVIKTPECQSVIPSYEEVKEIEDLRERYVKEFYKRLAEKIPRYRKAKELSRTEDDYGGCETIDTTITCNLVEVVEGKIHNTLLFSPLGLFNSEHLDVSIIHELVHAIELTVDANGNRICGFDILGISGQRENTSLNEVKTQLIAMDITQKLHQKGTYILSSEGNAKIRGATSYERESKLVEGFVQGFLQDILEVGMTGDIEKLLNKIGKENFERLSKAVEEHANISTFSLIEARQSNNPNHPILQKAGGLEKEAKEAVSQMEQMAHNGKNTRSEGMDR